MLFYLIETVTVLVLLGALAWVVVLRRRVRRLRALNRQSQKEQEAVLSLIDKLGEKITSKIDLDETLRIITEYIVQATHAESGAIFVVDDEGRLQARVVQGRFPPLHKAGQSEAGDEDWSADNLLQDRIEPGEGILGLVLMEEEPLLVTDPENDPRFPRDADLQARVHSMILCPLRVRGNVLGVFAVVNKRGEPHFDSRDLALLQALSDQAAVTVDLVKLYDVLAEQQRLEQELSVAHDFQRMLLPRHFPRLEGFELFAMSEAAMIVGGDYFDFFEVGDNHLGLVIADVSGKGIPGALIMAMVRAALRAEARAILSPKQVLMRVNQRVLQDTRQSVFITMIYGILDLRSGVLRFVRAGHEPLLILTQEGERVVQVAPEGIALGLVGPDIFENNEEVEVQLHPGDRVLLYTDGVIEAMDQSAVEYGRERLIARLKSARRTNAEGLIQSIAQDIHQFTLGIPQHDDITMLALCVTENAKLGVDGETEVEGRFEMVQRSLHGQKFER